MIRSITFKPTESDQDYRNAKRYKQVKLTKAEKRASGRFRRSNYKEVEDGFKNLRLRKCLTDRVIEFTYDKVNILFGPNGCGKTTILNSLAAACLCGDSCLDGWTSTRKYQPLDYGALNFFEEEYTQEKLIKTIRKEAGVECDVEWDAEPVFYHNLASRSGRNIDYGGFTGGLLKGTGEDILYRIFSHVSSEGENTSFLFDQLVQTLEHAPSFEEITDAKQLRRLPNETWCDCVRNSIDYLRGMRDKNPASGIKTLLLDEVDKSLDILSVILLYKKVLPKIVSKMDVQVIAVTHNPIILIDAIRNNKRYNIISMDEEYTQECLRQLKNDKF